jgi:hypothetical protein
MKKALLGEKYGKLGYFLCNEIPSLSGIATHAGYSGGRRKDLSGRKRVEEIRRDGRLL